MGSSKPQLSEPLQIGTWQTLLVADTVLVAKLKFLVTPLTYWKNNRMTGRRAKEIHNGPTGPYHISEDFNDKWTSILKSLKSTRVETTSTRSIIEERVGVELNRWVDSLVYDYYEIIDICRANDASMSIDTKLRECSQTDWSSMSPDPKSDIRKLCQNY